MRFALVTQAHCKLNFEEDARRACISTRSAKWRRKILSDSSVSWLVWLRVPMAVAKSRVLFASLNCGIVGTLMRRGGYFGSNSLFNANALALLGSDSLKFNLMVSADC